MRNNIPSSIAPGKGTRRARVKSVHPNTKSSRRTTITLSPESQEIVERFKSANGKSTSAAIDQIIQRSEPRPSRLMKVNGFLVLSVPPDSAEEARQVTIEDVKRAEDEMDGEYVQRVLYRDRETPPLKRKTGARQ